jgi:Kef-type K+ transport system membrane component KefB
MLSGFVLSSLLVGLALTTTAIGTLLPMMRDRQLLGTPFGDLLSAAGARLTAVAVVVELSALNGRDRVAPLPVHSLQRV